MVSRCSPRPAAPFLPGSSGAELGKGGQMRLFRYAVGHMGWLIGLQPTIFFFVVGLSTFLVKKDTGDSTPRDDCNTDDLRDKIANWLRYLLITVVFSVLFTLAVRVVVDAAADSEDKTGKKEEEAYEAALAEYESSDAARHNAAVDVEKGYYEGYTPQKFAKSRHDLSVATRSRKHAIDMVARVKPKTGIARLADLKRRLVRFGFFLAIMFSLGTSACASVAFYYSLQLQLLPKLICVNGATEVSPFAALGLVAVLIHLFLIWIALTQD